ncbi:hypothetical protein BO78DRAFT_398512 [Aspergillus sclerotiicarbonarius CBS 121057]|uniref:Uncharacterized protein n=1 Tax=Aspergillus sclerotiicarbonarius (strain CBS 121057 / IBT 28362) TaxID=1448318 RepID=A0A319EU78_ASPSB|nr:hypothetical protein BO78DRAFT_398512 [Aspergillus sclerotiicarbonarius CBS 121057]
MTSSQKPPEIPPYGTWKKDTPTPTASIPHDFIPHSPGLPWFARPLPMAELDWD